MSMCRLWLKAVNANASKATREKFRGAGVLGDKYSGYTVELRDGTQYYMGRQDCAYCARAEAIVHHGVEIEEQTV